MNIEKAKEQIQQLADKLKAELDAPEWPQVGEWYWTIDPERNQAVIATRSENSAYYFRKSIGWIWRTEAEAKKHLDKLQATERVRSYIAKANGDWVVDFSDKKQRKTTWVYDHKVGNLYAATTYIGQIMDAGLYTKPSIFDQLIEDCGDDIKLILGVSDE